MLVSLLFTAWIILTTVSSGEARDSTESSTENYDSSSDEMSSDEKSSDESNEVKDTSNENDSSSTEKDKSDEDDDSTEKDSSSTELNSSEERENKNSDESSEEEHGHGRSYVEKKKKKDDKYTKTDTFNSGSTLPPCAICNFQAGGVFIPWSTPCPGCSYRAPTCSSMGICCVMSSDCAKVQQGKPCPVNSHLGLPIQSMTSSIVTNTQLNLPMMQGTPMVHRTPVVQGAPMVHRTPMIQGAPYARPMGHQLIPGSIQQERKTNLHMIQGAPYASPMGHQLVPGSIQQMQPTLKTASQSVVYGSSSSNGLIPYNMLNNPVYQTIGLQSGGNVWTGGSMINPACPSTKAACATLGGTCIPSTQFCGGVHKQDEELCGTNCQCCIKPKDKDCSDRNKNCLSWASAGYCSIYPHIKDDCKVSCDICKPSPGDGTRVASSPNISNNQCPDKIPNCKTMATSTACATYSKMKELCPTTCGVPCTKSISKVEGAVCSRLTQNTCTDVLAGHCIPLDESCGGWFKEDPTLCGNGNCKCCITERCNVAPEDAAVCSHLGGKCIPASTKCRGSSYPLCGVNTCQCCVDNPSAFGSCSENKQCGNQGTCTLGGCHEGYEVTEGECAGPECYCCKKVKRQQLLRGLPMVLESPYETCSDKKCGDGGTCRDTTCLPGEVRLRENCGKGSCVCCKLAQNFDSPEESCAAKPCGSGGKCRCTYCEEDEERINGNCPKLDCFCCKKKIGRGTNKSYVRPSKPTNPPTIKPNSNQPYTSQQHPVDVLKSQMQPKGDSRYPQSRQSLRPSQPPNYGTDYDSYPYRFRNDRGPPECRPSKNNLCAKKGGDCIRLDYSCNGKSIVKYCGKSNTCRCCVPDAPLQNMPSYGSYGMSSYGSYGKSEADERSFSTSDHLVEPAKEEDIGPVNPPPISFTDEIESIENIQKSILELMEEDSQSRAEVNIESTSEDNNQNQAIENELPEVVDDAQSAIDDMKSLMARYDSLTENQQIAEIDDILDITTAASHQSDTTAETSIAWDNKAEESVEKVPSLMIDTPMDLEPLVENPVIKDLMESNYEMNILPELDMIDYYESSNMPLDETETGLYSDEYYEMSDIRSMINNDDKSLKEVSDTLSDNTATGLDNLKKASDNLDILNDMLSKNLFSSLDVKENSDEASDVDSVHSNSFMNLEDYYENNNNINIMDYYNQVEKDSIVPNIGDDEHVEKYGNTPIKDYYDQVEETESAQSGSYQSNYGNMYPSKDDGYYMAEYNYRNQYDTLY